MSLKAAFNLILIISLFVVCFSPLLETTKAQAYDFSFHGPVDENTGDIAQGTVKVYAHFSNNYTVLVGSVYSYVSYGGSSSLWIYHYAPITRPEYFEFITFNMTSNYANNITRQYWLSSNENTGVFYLAVGVDTTSIAFNIRALGGVDTGTLFSVRRHVAFFNSSIIEQRPIDKTGSSVANLLPNTLYDIVFLDENGSTYYSFGNINTITTPITLTLSPLSFPSDILLQYRYVHLYASRPTSDEIRIDYEDTKNGTVSVYYTIAFINGTVAYNNTQTVDSFSDIWLNADPSVTYYISATVVHSEFGTMYFQQTLSGSAGAVGPIDFAVFGNFAGVDTTQILGVLIVLIVFGVFSAFNSYIGIFAGVVTAGIMVWIGWLSSVTQAAVVAAFALTILLAITYWKRRVN